MKSVKRIQIMLILLAIAAVGTSFAAEPDSTAVKATAAVKEKPTLPPNTNPTQRVIFPAKGQAEDQQMADQLDCYRWASDQTKWDPYEAYDVLVEKGYVAAQTAEQAQGGLVKGAARGAAAGAIIGAIAGDAGKGAAIGAAAGGLKGGARSRRTQEAAQADVDAAIAEFEKNLDLWDRNYTACMTGKEYTVN